jgi:hypothetical protein
VLPERRKLMEHLEEGIDIPGENDIGVDTILKYAC